MVANELHHARVQALADNLDRWGSWRTAIASETVARLAARLPEAFDRVLLDAPCSGEGLFRRRPAAAAQWRPGHVRGSAERQRGLLADAARLVGPGGVLVYSTCTFAPEENEQQVAGFLAAHPGWELAEIPWHAGFAPGRPDWAPGGPPELARTDRLWPHRLRGEGHFIAKLVHPGEPGGSRWAGSGPEESRASRSPTPRKMGPLHGRVTQPRGGRRRVSTAPLGSTAPLASTGPLGSTGPLASTGPLEGWRGFAAEALAGEVLGLTVVGERVYGVPDPEVAPAGVRMVRPGLLLGRERPGRFEPAHALAMALDPAMARRVRVVDDREAAAWLRGETLADGGPGGWTLVVWDRWPLGWGRGVSGTLKNHYPKGLRTMRPAHA
jgi:NOL1/NOP2/fmu family ribosome biogenesis protein